MRTVFSHIVTKRLSQENENVATEALAFILQSSEAAKSGLLKLLRGIIPNIPNLWFRTQQMDGNTRPDMWGFDEGAIAQVLGGTDRQSTGILFAEVVRATSFYSTTRCCPLRSREYSLERTYQAIERGRDSPRSFAGHFWSQLYPEDIRRSTDGPNHMEDASRIS